MLAAIEVFRWWSEWWSWGQVSISCTRQYFKPCECGKATPFARLTTHCFGRYLLTVNST